MKNLTQKEIQKLQQELSGIMSKATARMNMTSGMWTQGTRNGLSPTDVDAKGKYSYQEPEQDEQGTYYGYKILHKNPNKTGNCGCLDCTSLVSPRYAFRWINGELTADREPDERHMHGIHFTKRPDHPELKNYLSPFHGYSDYMQKTDTWVLVKCALSGTIVETEQGFRAEHAQIIGVCDRNGYWQSYQDYQERAHADSRRISEPWQEETKWKYYGRTYTGIDPAAYIDPFDPNP